MHLRRNASNAAVSASADTDVFAANLTLRINQYQFSTRDSSLSFIFFVSSKCMFIQWPPSVRAKLFVRVCLCLLSSVFCVSMLCVHACLCMFMCALMLIYDAGVFSEGDLLSNEQSQTNISEAKPVRELSRFFLLSLFYVYYLNKTSQKRDTTATLLCVS